VLARATTYALQGVDAVAVTVEADIGSGLPAFTIVGLADTAVQEARERVRAAMLNTGLDFPLKRITVNLAPADLRKAGPGFDMALAAALLGASGQLPLDSLAGTVFCGELGLDGSARPVRGVLAVAGAAARDGMARLVVPRGNAGEAALVESIELTAVTNLAELVRFLAQGERPDFEAVDPNTLLDGGRVHGSDLCEVRGHRLAKRALEVAAAGSHNLLMVGPPGAGKSMLAKRMPTILPVPSLGEALETTRIHSVAGLLGDRPLIAERVFRAPHHSISSAGLIGGGPGPAPGEASLAHNGILFLDELAEFARPALEGLRQPLEEGSVRVTRAQRSALFPARFMLVAATNPCPCGHDGDKRRECTCLPGALARYRSKLSGPLLDRIDIVLRLDRPSREQLEADKQPLGSSPIRERVLDARSRQAGRSEQSAVNSEIQSRSLVHVCRPTVDAREALLSAVEHISLSVRGHDRALRVARTIADLEGADRVERPHVIEALTYRDFTGQGRSVVTA